MFSTREAEKLSGYPYRSIDKARGANCMPFAEETPTYGRDFSPFQVLMLLAQRSITRLWKVPSREAAWICRTAAEGIAANWDLSTTDGYLIRERRGEVFKIYIGNRAALAESLVAPDETVDAYEWSPEALSLLAEMTAKGASQVAISSALMRIDRERIKEWGGKGRQTIWFLELRPVFDLMFQSARTLNMFLPPLSDKEAWLGLRGGAE